MDLLLENTLSKIDLLTTEESITFQQVLALHINELIQNKFHQLVHLLYRLDVDEQGLKALLKKYEHEDAGSIIAHLIIERQLQKIESRKTQGTAGNIPGDDGW